MQNFTRGVVDTLGYLGAITTLITAIPALIVPWISFPKYVNASFCVGMVVGAGAGFAYARAKYIRSNRDRCLSHAKRLFGLGIAVLVLSVGFANVYNIQLVKGLRLQRVHDGLSGVTGLAETIGLFMGGSLGFCLMMSIAVQRG